ncbi:MAG: hypothetical protein OHK005_08080 [Candidatus Methylacidiphilales bacterium]
MGKGVLLLAIWVLTVFPLSAQVYLHVTEYGTGNLRVFDLSGNSFSEPSSYTPIRGVSSGADGMVTGPDGRLFINRDGGEISLRSLDGSSFTAFTTISGSPTLLDLTRTSTHLYAARYGTSTIYQVDLSVGTFTTLGSPLLLDTVDGLRLGPDGRLYALDSSDGQIFAYDFTLATWTTFLTPTLTTTSSQFEFSGDDVFVSRTVSGEARIYRYTLTVSGDYTTGLNPASETLIGSLGSGTATGIRLGPDNRLYANNFNTGEIWRSDVGVTSMESTAWVTGLNNPGSIYFSVIPEPSTILLLTLGASFLLFFRSKMRSSRSTLVHKA